jgi:hypothetical protein
MKMQGMGRHDIEGFNSNVAAAHPTAVEDITEMEKAKKELKKTMSTLKNPYKNEPKN